MPPDEDDRWREQRTAAAAEHAAAQQRRADDETGRARELLARFAAEATRRGLPVTRLKARGFDGKGSYETDVEGWYLRRNHTLGAGVDGSFYLLSVAGGLRARLRGATLTATDPPLVVGRGGRDGESIPLDELLTLRLAAGDDWD